jgi:repressor of nif and glnA expression
MDEKMRRKELTILETLDDADGPLSGSEIMDRIPDGGGVLSEKSIRLYLPAFSTREGLNRAQR